MICFFAGNFVTGGLKREGRHLDAFLATSGDLGAEIGESWGGSGRGILHSGWL